MRSSAFGSAWPGLVGRLGLLLLFLVAAGCGAGSKGKVSGRVTYNGEPVPGGVVTFRPADPTQNSVSAEVDEQGNYTAALPTGEVKISVDNRELEPRGPRGGPPVLPPEVIKVVPKGKPEPPPPQSRENAPAKTAGRYRKIPSKYYDITTSGLTYTVKWGSQEYNVELTD